MLFAWLAGGAVFGVAGVVFRRGVGLVELQSLSAGSVGAGAGAGGGGHGGEEGGGDEGEVEVAFVRGGVGGG